VLLAKNGPQIIDLIDGGQTIDILILDLDMPKIEESSIISRLRGQSLPFPVVVHASSWDYEPYKETLSPFNFVRKQKNSIDHLKRAISDTLKHPNRHRALS